MRLPRTTFVVVALTSITTLALAGCGSSGPRSANVSSSTPSAQELLRETFSGTHSVTSGQIELAVKLVPAGSSVLTAPITIAFGGPFQSAARGKLPQSDFTVTGTAQGHTGKLSIVSTGSAGYITVNGESYRLPAAGYNKLKSGLSLGSGSSSSSAGSSSGSSLLGKLGIDPLDWLTDPLVVGQASVGGADTDQITAKVNIAGLLDDLAKLAGKASSLGVSGASKLSGGLTASVRSSIAAHVKSPSVEIWTGTADQTLRKLAVALTVPVTGTLHRSLGGLSSMRVTINLQYADLNQPQTISAPTKLEPYSQLRTKLASDIATIEGGVHLGGSSGTGTSGASTATGASTTGSATTTGSSSITTGAGTTGSSLSAVEKRYAACMIKADGNVVKQQKCTALLGG
jgi:hypothetical protein